MKYVNYPVLIEKDEDVYNVFFIDFPFLRYKTTDFDEAIERAESVLASYIFDRCAKTKRWDPKVVIPAPTSADTAARMMTGMRNCCLHFVPVSECLVNGDSHLVKKTLTIPKKVNEIGAEAGVNFSRLLTEALVKEACVSNGGDYVRKTITIPDWANEIGIKAGVNFSRLLTDAVMKAVNSK